MCIRRSIETAGLVFLLTKLLNLLKLNTAEDLIGPGSLSKIELEDVEVYKARLSPAFKRKCKCIFVLQILCGGSISIRNV